MLFQRGILERLNAGQVLIGDGGMTYALEKRGYVKAGPWTPECTVEHPEAGQLVCHKESIEIAKQSFVIRSFFAYYYFFVFFSVFHRAFPENIHTHPSKSQ